MFVSFLVSLSWIPLVILNCLIYIYDVQIKWKYYHMVNVINYSNSFANPIVYVLRIPEFREALALCCLRRPAAPNIETKLSRKEKNLALTPATELRTLRAENSDLQLAFEQEVMDTKL